MGFAQVMQVVGSFAVILVALFLAFKLAKKTPFAMRDVGMKVVSRYAVGKSQNLVVAEFNGKHHLIAMSDGGQTVVDSRDIPEDEEQIDQGAEEEHVFAGLLRKAQAKAGEMTAGTQWAGLGKQKAAKEKTEKDKEQGADVDATGADTTPQEPVSVAAPEPFTGLAVDRPAAPAPRPAVPLSVEMLKAAAPQPASEAPKPTVPVDAEDPEDWMERVFDDSYDDEKGGSAQ